MSIISSRDIIRATILCDLNILNRCLLIFVVAIAKSIATLIGNRNGWYIVYAPQRAKPNRINIKIYALSK